MFFVNHQIELLPWLTRSPNLSPIENMQSMVAQRLTQITPPAATPDPTFAACGSCLVCCTPRTHPKSLWINTEACGSGDLQQCGYSGY
ncbi:uncharacterized protein TNCV_2751961 [Trichonephila clavipes]|nr:uncharacterized protein TNCV_2751961 [Trichonephila clavipes]